jgi:hypothetical protein
MKDTLVRRDAGRPVAGVESLGAASSTYFVGGSWPATKLSVVQSPPVFGSAFGASWAPLVALYCEDEGAKVRVQRILRRYVDFVQARALPVLASVAPDVSCTVLVIRRGSAFEEADYPAALRRNHPLHPLVIVSATGHEARGFARSACNEVVVLCDLERTLGAAVGRACLSGFLERLAGGLEGDRRFPSRLRVSLALLCRVRPPIRSVKELAAQVGCEPRTLEHHWRAAVPRAHGLRLHDLMGWMLLLHASAARLGTTNWAVVGAELGVCPQTIARLGRSLASLTLHEIAAVGPRETLARFRTRALPALAPRGGCAF